MKLYAWAVVAGGLGLLAGGGGVDGVLGQATPPPLAQLVATPILQGTGEELNDLELTCSSPSTGCTFNAYWDGNVGKTDQEAASGVYIYQLIVDGRRFTKKMIIMK